MSSSPDRRLRAATALVLALLAGGHAVAQSAAYPGIGRPATPKELAAWDIDVRPDFKGLPPGQGSVAQGQDIWESRCASCHGVFGESNQVFSPLIGGTTADDVKTGRVARLTDPAFPGRTTLMKVATVSTLWDYIHRAMPWNAPKSLKPDEVYAVTAFMLNLGGVVPDDFVLSDKTMAQAQARLPNRAGMTTAHGMWPGRSLPGTAARPDVQAAACMSGCAAEPKLASLLPDHARGAHGNLAEQNRPVGAQHGADTSRPAAAAATPATPAPAKPAAAAAPVAASPKPSAALSLIKSKGCVACHGMETRLVGPGFKEIAARHGSRDGGAAYLAGRMRAGSTGAWGAIPMPPQAVTEAEAADIAQWLMDGARK
ncbi:MAG: c-type cytochrome [Pseudomonadota bacterium]